MQRFLWLEASYANMRLQKKEIVKIRRTQYVNKKKDTKVKREAVDTYILI